MRIAPRRSRRAGLCGNSTPTPRQPRLPSAAEGFPAALSSLPKWPFPRPSAQGTPEALPSPILRRLSSTAHPSCDALRLAAGRSGGLPRRAGGAARAVGTAWQPAGDAGGCGRGGGATRPFAFPIRQGKRAAWPPPAVPTLQLRRNDLRGLRRHPHGHDLELDQILPGVRPHGEQ